MAKLNKMITIDPDVYFAIEKDKNFNVSAFCNDQLKQFLKVKQLDIPNDEKGIKEVISEKMAELSILKNKQEEMSKKQEEHNKRFSTWEEHQTRLKR